MLNLNLTCPASLSRILSFIVAAFFFLPNPYQARADYVRPSDLGQISEEITLVTIESTTSGGRWSETTTWVGGVVPTESDLVEIKGPVEIDGDMECAGLTVEAGATIQSEGNNRDLEVDGDLINYGTIQDNPDGSVLTAHVTGSISNYGTWDNAYTYLSSPSTGKTQNTLSTHTLTLGEGAVWGGYIYHRDDEQQSFAGSDIVLVNTFNLDGGSLDLQGYTLIHRRDGYVRSGTVFLTAFQIEEGADSGHDVHFVGDITLDGNVQINGSVTMEGTVTVAEGATLQNDGRIRRLDIDGDLINYGTIQDSPDGWYINLDVTGDLSNYGLWINELVLLTGTGPRTAYLPGMTGKVRIDSGEIVILTGENILPELTINSGGRCELTVGSSLYMEEEEPDEDLINNGEVIVNQTITGGDDYDFHRMGVDVPGDSGLNSLIVHHFGNQVPATYGYAARSWWRFETVPESSPAVLEITFYYDEEHLGNNDEDDLQVFHSEDGGQTWKHISTSVNLDRDTGRDWVRISDAPATGDFLLSSHYDPISVMPNVVMSVIGREKIRVGPPNRYTVHYANNSGVPTGDFVMHLATTRDVHIEYIEPSSPPGVDPQPIYPEDFAIVEDTTVTEFPDTLAWLLISSMAPREERSFTVVLDARPDDPQKMVEPITLTVGGIIGGVLIPAAIALAIDYIGDRFINTIEEIPASTSVTDAWLAGWNKARRKWSGSEAPLWTFIKWAPIAYVTVVYGIPFGLAAKVVITSAELLWNAAAGCFTWEFFVKYVAKDNNSVTDKNIEFCQSTVCKYFEKVTSWDPNEKVGPTGIGENGFMSSAGQMTYQILFENKAQATAPAWKIVIDDELSDVFDPSTVVFEGSSHEGWDFDVNGNSLHWEIEGIELPPNVNPPEGEGYVQFHVNTRDGLASGTALENEATIVFDYNQPITTNTFVNTLDYLPPVTVMEALSAESATDSVTVRWICDDGPDGSGIEWVMVYMSKDGGAFVPVGSSTTGFLKVDVEPEHDYQFYALGRDNVGNVEWQRPDLVFTHALSPVGVEDESVFTFSLEQNYPNPFNPETTFRFTLPGYSKTSLEVYDVLGRLVETIVDEERAPGEYHVRWDASRLASGVYFYRLTQGRHVDNRSLILVK